MKTKHRTPARSVRNTAVRRENHTRSKVPARNSYNIRTTLAIAFGTNAGMIKKHQLSRRSVLVRSNFSFAFGPFIFCAFFFLAPARTKKCLSNALYNHALVLLLPGSFVIGPELVVNIFSRHCFALAGGKEIRRPPKEEKKPLLTNTFLRNSSPALRRRCRSSARQGRPMRRSSRN